MPDLSQDNLLARLAGRGDPASAENAWASLAATQPEHDAPGAPVETAEATPEKAPEGKHQDKKLDELLGRVKQLVASKPTADAAAASREQDENAFVPYEPTSLREAELSEGLIEELILKYLLSAGNATGRAVADQVKLPFKLVEERLRQIKNDQLVVYRGTAPMNDYEYQLTDMGRERARRYLEHCTYFGAAPVSLKDYVASIKAQSLTKQHPTAEDLERAFSDLLLSKKMMRRLGPAINSGRGLFLYGAPGNGKSSIAERVTRAFGDYIWIPRAIGIDGEVLRLFDPSNHEEAPLEQGDGLLDNRVDKRWVRIRRPTIVVGGELTMASLEVTLNTSTGISEAPLQLKSNCGTLVIDDFGRQRMSTDELLNRWIVPLEKRYDFLNLPNGKKIQVPFDQLIVFSTNLEPKDLVDDAFLRRIPYKIDVIDPTEQEFRELFRILAPKLGFELDEAAVEYLIKTHYGTRPFRCCQPRDLLLQIRNFCQFQKQPPVMTAEYFDLAVENYFAVM